MLIPDLLQGYRQAKHLNFIFCSDSVSSSHLWCFLQFFCSLSKEKDTQISPKAFININTKYIDFVYLFLSLICPSNVSQVKNKM